MHEAEDSDLVVIFEELVKEVHALLSDQVGVL